jgi:hypothetical protein
VHLASRLGRSRKKVIAVSGAVSGISMDEITPYTSLDTSRVSEMTGFVPPCAFDVIDTVYGAVLARRNGSSDSLDTLPLSEKFQLRIFCN